MDSVLLPCLIEGADDRDPSHQDQGFSLRQWLYFRDARDLELAECSFFETDIHFRLTGPTHELGNGIIYRNFRNMASYTKRYRCLEMVDVLTISIFQKKIRQSGGKLETYQEGTGTLVILSITKAKYNWDFPTFKAAPHFMMVFTIKLPSSIHLCFSHPPRTKAIVVCRRAQRTRCQGQKLVDDPTFFGLIELKSRGQKRRMAHVKAKSLETNTNNTMTKSFANKFRMFSSIVLNNDGDNDESLPP